MDSRNAIRHARNRNAIGILAILALAGAIVGMHVGIGIWIVSELDDLKAELLADVKAELQASEMRQAEAMRAFEERQLAVIEYLVDEAVR